MKKILLALFLVFSFSMYGQKVSVMSQFFRQDSVSMQKAYELILSEAKIKYSFYKKRPTTFGHKVVYVFFEELPEDKDNPRSVRFWTDKYNTGNPDLEIEGDDWYSFSWVEGRFLDLAGFWIKYINPKISLQELSKKGDKYTYKMNGRSETIRLKKQSDNVWLLQNW